MLETKPNKPRELAYLLQGTEGEGDGEGQRAIWYTTNKRDVSIDWRDQICEQLDFCLPWKIAGWQPSSLQATLLTTDASSETQQPALLQTQG